MHPRNCPTQRKKSQPWKDGKGDIVTLSLRRNRWKTTTVVLITGECSGWGQRADCRGGEGQRNKGKQVPKGYGSRLQGQSWLCAWLSAINSLRFSFLIWRMGLGLGEPSSEGENRKIELPRHYIQKLSEDAHLIRFLLLKTFP